MCRGGVAKFEAAPLSFFSDGAAEKLGTKKNKLLSSHNFRENSLWTTVEN